MKAGNIILFFVLVVLIVIVIYSIATKDNPKVFYTKMKNFNARTIPPMGIFISKGQEQNNNLLKHELIHWEQYQRLGLLGFYYEYFKGEENGYDLNPLEIEARQRTGENDFAIYNYTYAVRNGLANTVYNPDFNP